MYTNNPNIVQLKNAIIRITTPPNATEVVVGFESGGYINRDNIERFGFAEPFLLRKGYACVSVLASSVHWYRHREIHSFLQSAILRDHLANFERIHTAGNSMGSFASMVFADLLQAQNVITFSPLTTASLDILPWEKRFEHRQALGWEPPFNDALDGLKTVKSVWGLFDPNHPDGRQAKRVKTAVGDRFHAIPLKGVNHAVPAKLLAAGELKKTLLHCLRSDDPAPLRRRLAKIDFAQIPITVKTAPGMTSPQPHLSKIAAQ